jgi:hypothetical protein
LSDAIDLKLMYLLKYSNLSADTIDRLATTIPVGRLRLVIAEYYLSKNDVDRGLSMLIDAMSYTGFDHSTSDWIDIWLGELATPKIHDQLTLRLIEAEKCHQPEVVITALRHAIEQTEC